MNPNWDLTFSWPVAELGRRGCRCPFRSNGPSIQSFKLSVFYLPPVTSFILHFSLIGSFTHPFLCCFPPTFLSSLQCTLPNCLKAHPSGIYVCCTLYSNFPAITWCFVNTYDGRWENTQTLWLTFRLNFKLNINRFLSAAPSPPFSCTNLFFWSC